MTRFGIGGPTNRKLGTGIHSWSIPAGTTCPGESHLCRTRCYAMGGLFNMPNVAARHRGNYEFSQTPGFSAWMISELRRAYIRTLRIHVAGDFYDGPYTEKWLKIVSKSPQTHFFTYTRSWRVEAILPVLLTVAKQSNCSLWWSEDRDTGPSPVVPGVRRAYLAIDDIDAANTPNDCDLVFRDQHGTIMKKANGILVCPAENGVHGRLKQTCTNCKFCWFGQRKPRHADLQIAKLPPVDRQHHGGYDLGVHRTLRQVAAPRARS